MCGGLLWIVVASCAAGAHGLLLDAAQLQGELLDLEGQGVENLLESAALTSEHATSSLRPGGFLLHIPKAAGASFRTDIIRSIMPYVVSFEGCYSWAKDFDLDDVLLMLRRPQEIVLSMYYHCRSAPYPPQWAKDLMPRTFGDWVRNWTEILAHGGGVGDFAANFNKYVTMINTYETSLPYKCYHPADVQVQRLTCSTPFNYPAKPDVNAALRALEAARFVGLVEAYHESVCLLHGRMRGKVPKSCNCEKLGPWSIMTLTHDAHNVTAHRLRDQPREVLEALDNLTAGDRVLYQRAVERFVRDVREVEGKVGVKILCPEALQRLQS